MTSYHIHVSIRGALAMSAVDFAQAYRGVFSHDDGSPMSLAEARQQLELEMSFGHEIVPGAGCDNFDWKTGCKGHEE